MEAQTRPSRWDAGSPVVCIGIDTGCPSGLRRFGFTIFHPMAGGVPPAMAWESLHLFEREVLPQLGSG